MRDVEAFRTARNHIFVDVVLEIGVGCSNVNPFRTAPMFLETDHVESVFVHICSCNRTSAVLYDTSMM